MGARIVPASEGMAEAVQRIRAGELVAFPTETVYGLGANALDAEAVAGIFAAKSRPSTNPLIVHIADIKAVTPLVAAWPELASELAAKFWPGPLTLVVGRSNAVPDSATAGGSTVGLRVPSHPVALQLLRETNLPIAAPSANRSEEVSPTTAQHVADSLGPWVDDLLILDGGSCTVGLESTVVDVSVTPPHLLRHGMVTRAQLEAVAGRIIRGATAQEASIARSPGMTTRHYSPQTPLILLPAKRFLSQLQPTDGLIYYTDQIAWPLQHLIRLPDTPEQYAAGLYSALRDMDQSGVQRIVVEMPPVAPDGWAAIHDRLRRAAAPPER